MDTLLYIAALMAFAPALLLMYAILRKYTYPAVQQPFFSDPSFFILFAVGLVAGTLLFALYTYLMATLMYVMLFSVLIVLAFMAILNLKRYHGKSDTVFYGYGLGYFERLPRAWQPLFALALFMAQVMFSRWWLARYRFGPAEWLWRAATYLRWPPMRRAGA